MRHIVGNEVSFLGQILSIQEILFIHISHVFPITHNYIHIIYYQKRLDFNQLIV